MTATDRPRAWIDDPWSAMTTGEGEAYRRGWEAARATIAANMACGCPHRDAVTKAGPNSAERWRLCGEANCAAIEVLAIAALEPAP